MPRFFRPRKLCLVAPPLVMLILAARFGGERPLAAAGAGGSTPAQTTPGALAAYDFSGAAIVVDGGEPDLAGIAEFLQLEIERRSGVLLPLSPSLPAQGSPAVVLGVLGRISSARPLPAGFSVPEQSEGFAVGIDHEGRSAPTLYVIGRDRKGVLFGTGWLIRKMYLAKGFVRAGESLSVSTAPAYPLRGQQIIKTTQSDDRFIDWNNTSQRRQYIRDLALFGTNLIEPKDPSDIDDFCEDLGIDLAYTVNCSDVIDLNQLSDSAIRGAFSDAVGIDQFVTYGGDHSGSRPPEETFPAMERVVPLVLERHPGATWWYSNQCLEDHAVDHDDYIFAYLRERQPQWLYGLIYGPWTKRGIPEIRADLPAQYRIRHYPDICHVRWCQYPVPRWDRAWAQVWDRNVSIYAMPRMFQSIHSATREYTVGATPYNHTGAYNDLNKFVFSAMGWDPDATIETVLQDYGRAFFAYSFDYLEPSAASIERAAEKVASALLLLEDNWVGPIRSNDSTERALSLWQEIAREMGGPVAVGNHWRLELFLTKAFLDAQVKRKYDAEMQLQREAYDALEAASEIGVRTAVRNARAALERIDTEFQPQEEFLEMLQARGITGRYGDLEKTVGNLYSPLADRGWLEAQLSRVRSLEDIERLIEYEDPGPGGFYDNLGVEGQQPHLVRTRSWREDPGFVHSPIEWNDHSPGTSRRQSQHAHAVTRYDTPLIMRWENLDPNGSYSIEVVYRGPFGARFRCDADDGIQIHGPRGNTEEDPARYDIPPASLSDGTLQLEWRLTNATRGASVTEVWLRKGGWSLRRRNLD